MNKAFDHDRGGRTQWIAWLAEIMREALRVSVRLHCEVSGECACGDREYKGVLGSDIRG